MLRTIGPPRGQDRTEPNMCDWTLLLQLNMIALGTHWALTQFLLYKKLKLELDFFAGKTQDSCWSQQ